MSEPAPPCKRPPRRSPLDPATPSGAALRTTLAATLAMALAYALHVEVPSLAVVYVLAHGSAGTVTMVAGALTGETLGLVLLQLFDQSRVAFTASLFALTALGTYGALGRRFPYGFVQALLSLLVLVGQSLDTPDAAVEHAFFDLANVLIAALCAFVAGAGQPATVPGALRDALAARLRTIATVLRAAPDRDGAAAIAQHDLLARRTAVLLAAAWPTRLASRRRHRALASATTLVDAFADRALVAAALARLAPSEPAEPARREALAAAIGDLAPLIGDVRGALSGDPAARRADARTLAAALRRAPQATLADARGTGEGSAVARRVALGARVDAAARRRLARLALLAPFLGPGIRAVPPSDPSDGPLPALAFDRFRLRHSVKSAAAYLLVFWAWVAAGWGAIVPALVVSVLVATLATPIGATLRKAVLRVGGVLAGGLAGLAVAVALLPWITTLPAICALSAAVLLAFLWVQHHHEALSFAGLQGAIAFTLTLVHGTAPSPTWREPLESLIGLAFGIVVVVGVMHAAWPIDATTSARAVLADLLELCARRLPAALDPHASPPSLAGSRRLRAAARDAREHAAGFVHEVALYGPQFGRPREDLAGLLRPVVQLDALVATIEGELPRARPAAPEADAHGRSAARARALAATCCRLARELRAPLGDLPPARAAEPKPSALPRESTTLEQASVLADRLLEEVHARLHAGGALPRRDAA